MIIWLNGPFGAGKTKVARLMLAADPGLVLFDTEQVAYLLRPALAARRPVTDFQDWQAWRTLTASAVAAVHGELDGDLLVPQTVVVQRYWTEITDALVAQAVPVRAFTLDVQAAEHRRRIDADVLEPDAAGWRHQRRKDYEAALGWLGDHTDIVDTTHLTAEQVANRIRSALEHQTDRTTRAAS